MIFLVIVSQILKLVFDAYAKTWLENTIESDTYEDISSIWEFNQVCMFLDSINIILSSISLLKYTSIAVPGLNTITYTIIEFSINTVKKTIFLILLIYTLFGLISHFILSFYQYGFNYLAYALLRSCIVFLNGFIINE